MIKLFQIRPLDPYSSIIKLFKKYFDVERFFVYNIELQICVMYVTDIADRACSCLKSVLRLGVDKDHRTLNWVLILYQTCTTIEMN